MDEVTGGILGDDMGLGKTLSMLAAIVVSLDDALRFAYNSTRAPIQYWQDITPSKSTLVIVPSACQFNILTRKASLLMQSVLLESWTDEVER